MKHVFKIADKYDAFFCPVNKLYLSFYNPVGEANIVSNEIKLALKFKKIIDVNGTVEAEKSEAQELAEKIVEKVEAAAPVEPVEEIKPVVLTKDEDILEDMSKKEMLAYIKEHDLDMKELGLNSKSGEDKIREALAAHLEKEDESNEEKKEA